MMLSNYRYGKYRDVIGFDNVGILRHWNNVIQRDRAEIFWRSFTQMAGLVSS